MIPEIITESTALGDITTTDPVTILAPIAAALAAIVAFAALYAYLRSPAWVFGPQARFLNGTPHKL